MAPYHGMEMTRFALLGCGRIAHKHVDAIGRIPGVQLVTACDVQMERAQKLLGHTGIPLYTDMREMLTRERIDVLCVLTPSGMHAEHTLLALDHVPNIIVEKPMALRLEDAEAMVEKASQVGGRLFVVKQNRFNLPVQAARTAFEDGRFGKMVMGTVRVRWCRPQAYYDQDSWRGTWALDGGVLANQASHHVDLLQWFMGDVESVFAKTATRLVNIETEDTAVAVLKFTSGALGVIEATTATRPKDLEGSLSLMGETGSVVVEGFAVNKVRTWHFADGRDDSAMLTGVDEMPSNVYGNGHLPFLTNVVESIRANKPSLIDGLEGMKSLRLLHALYESAETGQEIKLVFRPEKNHLGQRAP